MKFCTDYGLVILNGCTLGDDEGDFTFISGTGQSVIDYCAVSQDLLNLVESFNVDTRVWSDHMPISLTLKFEIFEREKEHFNLLPKLIWKEEFIHEYQNKMNENLRKLSEENTILTLKALEYVVKNSAIPTVLKNTSFVAKSKWFNGRCSTVRKKCFKWLRRFKRTGSVSDKDNYLKSKQEFRRVESEAKSSYFQNLDHKINMVKIGGKWLKK